ncbi:sulfurtransferase [Streptomyces sp. WI04-05B]|uniref:sulfurtransferase n=1 Tax=Streptomyces TaxID=1883 RepID=UPI0029B1337F|nr:MULTISPECIES: sulfurtransferase [unclassified Streptomyces]MDX2545795.1 sulfurtransferase [Streptomyces sp. WI04-05B]MDX2583526.1 sulfurtransferase [Streptomyces sp. WI04-05A]MDX3745294.1 sulfurtransferase [Streptomyces sp. AK08-02]
MSASRVTTTVAELRDALASGHPPLVLDVRWALGDPYGCDHYADAHIPGAVYVDLDTELAAPANPEGGRHPLPDLAELQTAARGWGLRQGQPVVVYDDLGNTAAARAWWLLRYAGVADVTLLDGALGAWRAAELPQETGVPVDPEPGDVVLASGGLPLTDADGAAELSRDGLLLDARAAERYRGEVEPVDPRAGHIPGAVSAPTGENLATDGTFLSPELLRKRFEDRGAGDASRIGVYCGSGVTATHQIAALTIAGFDATLFAGSWSAWSADPTRPAATGPEPS